MYEALKILSKRLHEIDNELKSSQMDVEEYQHALRIAENKVVELQKKYDDLESAIELIEQAM